MRHIVKYSILNIEPVIWTVFGSLSKSLAKSVVQIDVFFFFFHV